MKEQLTLGELISKLEEIQNQPKKDRPEDVYFDFCHNQPYDLDSYRGHYNQIAISWLSTFKTNVPLGLESFILELKESLTRTFYGYKGGEYRMNKETPVWVSNYSHVSNTAIVGVRDCGWCVILETEYIDQ